MYKLLILAVVLSALATVASGLEYNYLSEAEQFEYITNELAEIKELLKDLKK